MDTSQSDVAVTPLKANQWNTSLDRSSTGLEGIGFSANASGTAPPAATATVAPSPPTSSRRNDIPARYQDDSDGDEDIDEGEITSRAQQLQLKSDMALGRTDHHEATERRGITPISAATSTRRGSEVSSARAMARKISGGGPATDAARMIALEEECRSLSAQVHSQEKGLVQLTAEADKAKKQVLQLQNRLEKEMASNKDLTAKLKVAESQTAIAKKELAVLQRQASKTAVSGRPESVKDQKDVRLQRALEELEKCQAQLKEKENSNEGGSGSAAGSAERHQIQHLTTENKKLEAQRVELLACIRKQSKLIDVLKRQKMHLEAAKLLQITEEEFTKALETNLEV